MEKKKKDRLVIFESLGFSSIPAVYWYAKKNYKIKYFTIDQKINKIEWFKRLLVRHHIDVIKWDDFDLYFNYLSHDLALDSVEQIYDKWFKDNRLIHHIVSFMDSEKVHLIYKKDLVVRLESFYYIYLHLNNIAESTNNNIIFIQSQFNRFEKLTDAKLNSNIHTPLWSRTFTLIKTAIEKSFYTIALGSFPFWIILWKTRKIISNNTDPIEYQVGLRVYREDWGFLFKYRTVDFLIDGKNITKDNSIFCIESDISDSYKNNLKSKYNVVEMRKILNEIDLSFIKNVFVKKIIPCTLKSCYMSISKPAYLIETTIGILYNYMTWTMFIKKYHLKHYVVYTHFEKYHVVRNIILSQNGVKTWYYVHSTHHIDLFESPHEKATMRHVIYSYLYYDNLVSWGDKSSAIFARGPNSFIKYQNLGCLWSEHARMLIDSGIASDIRKNEFNDSKSKPLKILGVFDTSFGKMVPLQINDMILFIEGILLLLEKHPDIGVIFKQKKIFEEMADQSPEHSDTYNKLYNKLQSHERCYSTGRFGETCEVIAASDLVVSACFTSTTPEALGARKKAIFFDAASRFKGLYYDKFPKMVAHGFDEFDNIVKYWLYEVNDAQFDEYIDTYVKGELDSCADGKAITRFRKLLSEDMT